MAVTSMLPVLSESIILLQLTFLVTVPCVGVKVAAYESFGIYIDFVFTCIQTLSMQGSLIIFSINTFLDAGDKANWELSTCIEPKVLPLDL